jgi:hypothetical protein
MAPEEPHGGSLTRVRDAFQIVNVAASAGGAHAASRVLAGPPDGPNRARAGRAQSLRSVSSGESEAIVARVRDTGQPVAFEARGFAFPDQLERARPSFARYRGGISPEVLYRVLDPFHTTKQMGLGASLHVSRNTIDVGSQPGDGSTIMVWLLASQRGGVDDGVTDD